MMDDKKNNDAKPVDSMQETGLKNAVGSKEMTDTIENEEKNTEKNKLPK